MADSEPAAIVRIDAHDREISGLRKGVSANRETIAELVTGQAVTNTKLERIEKGVDRINGAVARATTDAADKREATAWKVAWWVAGVAASFIVALVVMILKAG